MKQHALPPLVAGFSDGNVTWQKIEAIDYDTLGYLLSCHLIIEHYLDNYLSTHPGAKFNWGAARLSFSQKITLIAGLDFPDKYNFPPLIKHLNSVRNRFGHNINAKLTDEDLLPIRNFLEKCIGSKASDTLPSDAKEILGLFTTLVCAYFASAISYSAGNRSVPKDVIG